jgi:Tfp pilus assembly protein PilF
VTYSKLLLSLVSLLIFVPQLSAQWRPSSWPGTNADQMGNCREIEITVRDSMGMVISDAVIVTDSSAMPFTTDIQGLTEIPCFTGMNAFSMLEVRAPGYRASRVRITPDANYRLEVILDKQDPVAPAAGAIISAKELNKTIQMESQELQNRAASAIRGQDYNTAGTLLLKALELTPSNAEITNNLGVIALHKKDLNAAGMWFEKAMKMAPRKAVFIGNLGIVRWIQARTEESYTLLKRAASMGYESGPVNYVIGKVSLTKGENTQAIEYFKKTSTDRFPYRDLYLSIALYHLGNTKAAEETYYDFLRRNPFPYAFGIPPN